MKMILILNYEPKIKALYIIIFSIEKKLNCLYQFNKNFYKLIDKFHVYNLLISGKSAKLELKSFLSF